MDSKIVVIKREPKFALQRFEEGSSVLIKEMDTPETKIPPAAGSYLVFSCIKCFILGQEAPIFT